MVQIKIVNKGNHPLPQRQSDGASGLDIQAFLKEPVVLTPLERTLIPTGLYVECPLGYEIQIRARSGLALNHGISLGNGIGTIDSDYRGEIGVILINLSNEDYTVYDGDRIAQMVCLKTETIKFKEEELSLTKRNDGGFGHSGY